MALPHNLVAEGQVLGACLLSEVIIPGAIAELDDECFFTETNLRIWHAIVAEYRTTGRCGIIEVKSRLAADCSNADAARQLGDAIDHVAQDIATTANMTYHCRLIKELSARRRLIKAAQKLARQAQDQSLEIADIVSAGESDLTTARFAMNSSSPKSAREIAKPYLTEFHAAANGLVPPGLHTGLTAIDVVTGGFRPGELVIAAGRPGMGKSALAIQICHRLAVVDRIPCAFFSLEMSTQQVLDRLVSIESGIPGAAIRDRRVSTDQLREVSEAMGRISAAPLWIQDEANRSMSEIRAEAKALRSQFGIRFLAMDYLQLARPDNPRKVRYEQVTEMSLAAKALPKELGIPCLVLSQVSRECERQTGAERGRPTNSALRESGQLEQDAHIIMLLWRPEVYRIDTFQTPRDGSVSTAGLAVVDVSKHRSGSTGLALLSYDREHTMFGRFDMQPAGTTPARSGGPYYD